MLTIDYNVFDRKIPAGYTGKIQHLSRLEYYYKERLQRIEGPAVEWNDGFRTWALSNERIHANSSIVIILVC